MTAGGEGLLLQRVEDFLRPVHPDILCNQLGRYLVNHLVLGATDAAMLMHLRSSTQALVIAWTRETDRWTSNRTLRCSTESLHELARKFGLHRKTIERRLKLSGVNLRSLVAWDV